MSSIAVTLPPRSGPPSLWTRVRALLERRETIRYLVTSQLRGGHRDKVLGHIWNILDPLLLMGVYYLVFGVILGLAGDDTSAFLAYLFIGVVAWRFFDSTVSQATQCIRSNRGLIHEINFPKAILPIAVCLSRLYDLLWGFAVLFVVLFLFHPTLTAYLLWFPVILSVQLIFTAGVAFFVAYLGAFYADVANITSVVIRLWFYASPIFYFVSGEHARIPERYLPYYMLNPLACMLEAYRSVLLWARAPDPSQLGYAALVGLLSLVIGFAVFSRGEGAFAKYV